MIAGTVVLEDVTIHFVLNYVDGGPSTAQVRVQQLGLEDRPDEYECGANDFLKALAIAVHPDGEPNVRTDYEAAERAQGENVRWIP